MLASCLNNAFGDGTFFFSLAQAAKGGRRRYFEDVTYGCEKVEKVGINLIRQIVNNYDPRWKKKTAPDQTSKNPESRVPAIRRP